MLYRFKVKDKVRLKTSITKEMFRNVGASECISLVGITGTVISLTDSSKWNGPYYTDEPAYKVDIPRESYIYAYPESFLELLDEDILFT
jgi:hypothetical protein